MEKLIDEQVFYDVFYSTTEKEAEEKAILYLKNGAIRKYLVEEDNYSKKYKWVLWAC